MTITIWHNPRCSKSRQTLELLRSKGITPTIREYLKQPPSKAEVETLIDLVGGDAKDLIRDGEPEFKTLKQEESRSRQGRHRQGDRRSIRSCCSGRSWWRASAPPSAGRPKRCCRF